MHRLAEIFKASPEGWQHISTDVAFPDVQVDCFMRTFDFELSADEKSEGSSPLWRRGRVVHVF